VARSNSKGAKWEDEREEDVVDRKKEREKRRRWRNPGENSIEVE